MIFERERSALVDTLHELQRLNLTIGTAGNVSLRVDTDRFVISPAGVRYATMVPEDICVVDATGELVEGIRLPTSETQLHLGIYARTSHRAIVHTHSSAAVAVSTLVDELPRHHYYINNFGGEVRVAPYRTYGTRELADAVRDALGTNLGVLMANHGGVCVGTDLVDATERASLLEWLCKTWLDAQSAGMPTLISKEQLEDALARRTRTIYDEMTAPPAGAVQPRQDTSK